MRAWNQWSIYPPDFLGSLENTFLENIPVKTVLPAANSSNSEEGLESELRRRLENLDGTFDKVFKSISSEDLDGEELDGPESEDIDGEPLF